MVLLSPVLKQGKDDKTDLDVIQEVPSHAFLILSFQCELHPPGCGEDAKMPNPNAKCQGEYAAGTQRLRPERTPRPCVDRVMQQLV